jgi:FkbM family methyltransferase
MKIELARRPRANTSDIYVFYQVYCAQHYSAVGDIGPGVIIDAGANVGYSSCWLADRYPTHSIIAIEPEPANYAIAAANVERFGDRVQMRHAALWHQPASIAICGRPYRDGLSWATQVEPATAGAPGTCDAVTVDQLLAESASQRVALLKVDIEGAEAVVFSDASRWVDRVDAIAIELHDDSQFGDATAAFNRAISGRGFVVERAAELTIAKRPAPAAV